ncbi:DUF1257 domain-containing protein [Metabacillus bambusae]|uniref:DUF1257 domain-containing protein n=1 Tax=Metabacillus bambusae TaxID=2795218 RepID=A0ABS3NAV4_9BACI|nr:DUF1257 domain-containing protein [Metabacillus bambusae]MBO1515416.1 DUF1257 domain-containing protein [Metabacillus bambusae]
MSIELVLIPVAISVTQLASNRFEKKFENRSSYKLQSFMNDEILVKKALEQYGCSYRTEDHALSIEDFNIGLLKNDDSVFEAIFDSTIKLEDAQQFLSNLEEEYTHLVQQETYKKLIQRAKEQGMVLETEMVNEQNSIVLTFKV